MAQVKLAFMMLSLGAFGGSPRRVRAPSFRLPERLVSSKEAAEIQGAAWSQGTVDDMYVTLYHCMPCLTYRCYWLLVVAAHSSSCSPGAHLHRQI